MLLYWNVGIFEDISNQDFSQDLAPTPTENTQLKAVLATITALHHESFASIAKKVESQLQNLKQALKITAEMQDTIRGLKNVVSSQMITIDAYRESLKAVYDDSDLLALMNLTKLKLNPELYRCHQLNFFLEELLHFIYFSAVHVTILWYFWILYLS